MESQQRMDDAATSQWGRVAVDGTVYVRTREGERPVGSWHAGSATEGLEYYARRYAELAADVTLLEHRLSADAAHAKDVLAAATRLRAGLPEARVVGDLDALDVRLRELEAAAKDRMMALAAARAEERVRATEAKRALVEEAELLAQSSGWKTAGDRLRAIAEEWRAVRGADRKTETELWQRFVAARDEFSRRRGAHFAALKEQRDAVRARKEELIARAEALAESSDWRSTAAQLRDLTAQWKEVGRAGKDVDDALWSRFRAAQDRFFTRRSAAHSERETEWRRNADAREQLVKEAEALDPHTDPEGVRRRLRELKARYAAVGRVPREAEANLDRRLEAVEERLRNADAGRSRARDASTSPLVIRLRESIAKLEDRVARAKAAGDQQAADQAETALNTQRQWLAQAERR